MLEGWCTGDINSAIRIVFDHKGRVLRTGEEASEPTSVESLLEMRYPGIRISDVTVGPVRGPKGQPITGLSGRTLQLHCVWLAAEAQMPRPRDDENNETRG